MPASKLDFDALVVGAGLAGSAVAHVLAMRGLRVGVLEKRREPALAASGNPAGVLIPYLTKTATAESRFYGAAWRRILDWPLLEEARVGRRGALHLIHKPAMEDRFAKAIERLRREGEGAVARPVTQKEASELSGVELKHKGIFYPDGGLVSPRKLCILCLDHKNIQLYRNTHVLEAVWHERPKLWEAKSISGVFRAPFLILANAHDAKALAIASWLPVYPVRGQIFYLEGEDSLKELCYPLSYDGYITPLLPDGRQILGASFEHWNTDPEVRGEQNEGIYGLAAGVLPELARRRLPVFGRSGRVAFRSTSTDRFPIVGPLADFAALQRGITEDRRQRHKWSLRWPWDLSLPGVYVSLAHASRGILSVLLSAELIAEAMENTGRPSLVSEEVRRTLSSSRFLRRHFRKTGNLSVS